MALGPLNKISAVAVIALLVATLGAAPAAADPDKCVEPGIESATVPRNASTGGAKGGLQDQYTVPAEPLSAVDFDALNDELVSAGELLVGSQVDGEPNDCRDLAGNYTGFDNLLLRAVADKLGLRIKFEPVIPTGDLVDRVRENKVDVGSASQTSLDSRRQKVDFTNGYDFGFNTLVVPLDSAITGFDDITNATRVGVLQNTAQAEFVANELRVRPIVSSFPDFTTVYENLKTRRIDVWVAPERTARRAIEPGDPAVIVETRPLTRFVAWPVAKGNQTCSPR